MRHGVITEYDPKPGVSIASLAYEYPRDHQVPDDAHGSDQLIFATRGLMEVGAGRSCWLIPPVAISQHILGVRPEIEGLRVSPCIGPDLPSFTVVRKCRGWSTGIRVTNEATGRPPRLVVDGKPDDGTLVPYAKPGSVVSIDCEV